MGDPKNANGVATRQPNRRRGVAVSAVCSLLLWGGLARAETTVGGYSACITQQAYDELVTAIVQKDTAAMNYLAAQNLCVVLKDGMQASILERGWTGWVKARIYAGDTAVVVWGPMEAFN